MPEHRRFSRVPFLTPSVLTVAGQRTRTRLIDISLKGALVEQPRGWKHRVGTRCTLEVQLEPRVAGIVMEAEVAHTANKRVGLRCTAIDVDSITHLRRLLELNLGDPQLVEREVQHLG